MKRFLKFTGIFLGCLLFLAIIVMPIVITVGNDQIAANVMRDIRKLPLPEQTEYAESFSIAGKYSGNGNGMQYAGGILIKSELSLEELKAYYAQYPETRVRQQENQCPAIASDYHGSYRLKTEISGTEYFVVFAQGHGNAFFEELDIRGH